MSSYRLESFLAACYEAAAAEYAAKAAHEVMVKAKNSRDEEAFKSAKQKFQAAHNLSCAAKAKYISSSAEMTHNANLLRNKQQPPSRAKGKS